MQQTVRTTINLPEDLHRELRLQAVREKKSLSGLVTDRLSGRMNNDSHVSVEERIRQDFELFDDIGRSGRQIDLVKALREERDRDNA
ncbi:MAG: hypothetical protein Q7S76_03590 [bacterium]|nr:hypothetical protein [bacterium]